MAKLKLLGSNHNCDDLNIGGYGAYGYVTCTDELATYNRSKREMSPTTHVQGQLLEVGEAHSFAGAPTGKGYFRKFDAVVDMTSFEGTWTGGEGSVKIEQTVKVRMGGMSTATMEEILAWLSCCGTCFVIPDKMGQHWEFGNKLNPAKVTKAALKNDKDGSYIEVEIMPTFPPRVIDVVALPLDIVPN